jgi:predicted O-methyltransferase YrrM
MLASSMTRHAWIQFAKEVRAAWQRLWPNLPGPKAQITAPRPGRVGEPRQHPDHPHRPHTPIRAWSMVEGLDPATPWARELAAHYADSASFPGSISPQAGMLLHALTLNQQPKVAVEVGSFLGASTLWIASALESNALNPTALNPNATVHAVDRFALSRRFAARRPDVPRDIEAAFRQRLSRANLTDRVKVHVGDSPRLLANLRRELLGQGGVDLAFIDGDHTIPGVVRDFWAIEPALAPGALVVFHDTEPSSGHEGPRFLIDALRKGALGAGGLGAGGLSAGSRFEITELPIAPLDFGIAIARKLES